MNFDSDTAFDALADSGRYALDQMFRLWNQTDQPYEPICLHTLFERQVQSTPDAIALICQNEERTYAEVNQRANQLAHYLWNLGVRPEVLVGVCMTRTMDLIVALLAIQKAGGAYVPIDPTYPADRITFMLEDARAPILVTQLSLLSGLPELQAKTVCVDRDWALIGTEPCANPGVLVDAYNLAYIIYTSGSTGRPKGVAITHANASALLAWAERLLPHRYYAGVLAATSVCFDLSVYEIYLPLSVGGTVILAENALQLPTLPQRGAVTLVNTVPSAMGELVRLRGLPASVRIVNLAGEPLRHILVQSVYQTFSNVEAVYNLYGPSEDTTYSTWARIEKDDALEPSIGYPIANSQAYILDESFKPVPVGAIGELFLGGEGVSRGYLNRPALTAERYVPDPFSGRAGARLYRTGDQSRYRPDGKIEFLGRMDHQVKIRGFRIELGEIEAVLSRHPNMDSQVVIAREAADGSKQLVAYFVAKHLPAPSVGELRQHLLTKLPEYMLPSYFIRLEQMPLNPNGKIERKALPAPDESLLERGAEYVAPRTPIEERLAHIWGDVLRMKGVGIHDNFFELGGHSLLATQVTTRIREAWQVDLAPRVIFDAPTDRGVSAHCRRGHAAGYARIAHPNDPARRLVAADVAAAGDVVHRAIRAWHGAL